MSIIKIVSHVSFMRQRVASYRSDLCMLPVVSLIAYACKARLCLISFTIKKNMLFCSNYANPVRRPYMGYIGMCCCEGYGFRDRVYKSESLGLGEGIIFQETDQLAEDFTLV